MMSLRISDFSPKILDWEILSENLVLRWAIRNFVVTFIDIDRL